MFEAGALAFAMHMDIGFVGYQPRQELRRRRPIVLFTPLSDGWQVLTHHIAPSERTACSNLRARLIVDRGRLGGELRSRSVLRVGRQAATSIEAVPGRPDRVRLVVVEGGRALPAVAVAVGCCASGRAAVAGRR
jgi:hypothetical protein